MEVITRRISNAVYSDIIATGLVKRKRRLVFDYIVQHGPVTISQALAALPHKRDSTINARFSELCRMGLIEIVAEVDDPEGTQKVALWAATGRMPIALPKADELDCVYLENYGVRLVFNAGKAEEDITRWIGWLNSQLFKAPVCIRSHVRLKEVKPKKPSVKQRIARVVNRELADHTD